MKQLLRKLILSLVVITLMLGTVTACYQGDKSNSTGTNNIASNVTEAPSGEPVPTETRQAKLCGVAPTPPNCPKPVKTLLIPFLVQEKEYPCGSKIM